FPFALRTEGDIYVMSRNGDELARVTTSPGWDGSPAWSADGKTLFFYSERDEQLPYRIYAVDLDGGEARPVSPAGHPALSPALGGEGRILYSTWTGGETASRRWHAASVSAGGDVR